MWRLGVTPTVRPNGDGMHIGLRTIGVCALLTACATDGALVEAAGVGPDLTRDATFTVDFARMEAGGARAVADAAIPDLVARRLSEKGMAPAGAAPGRYLVEVGYGGRPAAVGAYVDATAAPQDRSIWLDAPRARGWRRAGRQICTLSARFTETATGAEVFRVSAAEEVGKAGCEAATARLLDAALAKLPPQPSLAAN